MYGRAAADGGRQALRAWPLAVALPAYIGLIVAVLILTAQLGFVGGIAAGFGLAAVASSYLHLLALAVGGPRDGRPATKVSLRARPADRVRLFIPLSIF